MSTKLRDLTEELGKLVSAPGPTLADPAQAQDIASFEAFRKLALASSKDISKQDFSAHDLRLLNTFIIGIQFARTMSPTAARGYIGAMWRSGANIVVPKLVFGDAIERHVEQFLSGGPQG